MTAKTPAITLDNGVQMPALGLGVFQSPPAETAGAVEAAFATGYRLIDTAAAYGNEREHPYFQQTALQRLHAEHGIATQAWSPMGGITAYRGLEKTTFADPTLLEIARQHGKSAAQVMLRWHLQKGRSAIPKSVKPARIAENFAVFDFELTREQVAAIDALDTGLRSGPEPDSIRLDNYGRAIPEA